MLIIVCGLPGSGKTTIAKALSDKLGGVYISSDIIRKEMHRAPSYDEDEKRSVYREMAGKALKLFRGGEETVVLDATFYKKEYLDLAKKAAQLAGCVMRIVVCKLDRKETKKRLESRKAGPSDADFDVYLKVKNEFEAIQEDRLEIDTSEPIGKNIGKITGYFDRIEKVGGD